MILRKHKNVGSTIEYWSLGYKDKRTWINTRAKNISWVISQFTSKEFFEGDLGFYPIIWQKEYNSIEEIKEDFPEEFI